MAYFLTLTTENLPILKIVYFIKVLLSVAFIIVPIILIIVSVIELSKLLFNPNETNKSISKIINKMISAVIIFFIPIFVNFIMNMISQNSTDKIELWTSADNVTIKKLTILKEKETAAKKREADEKEIKQSQENVTKKIDEINSLVDELGDKLSETEKEEIEKAIEEAKVAADFKLSDDKRRESLEIINTLKNYSEIDISYELNTLEQILNNQAENQNKSTIEECIDNIHLAILQIDDIPSDVNLNFSKLKQNLDFSSTNINNIKSKLKILNKKADTLNQEVEEEKRKQESQNSSNNSSGNTVYASELTIRDDIVNYATSFVGVLPYKYGGTSLTTGVDCSGFVMKIYEHFGYSIPRTTTEQAKTGTKVALTNLKKGDLVFSRNYGHVTLYIGNGQVVQAQCTACGPVKITNIPSNAIDAVRIIND